MRIDEFEEKFCKLCGTQLCGGVLDEELREGCLEYRYYFPHGERTTIRVAKIDEKKEEEE